MRTANAEPHAYDYARIACPCGHGVGYRPARSQEPLRCQACDVTREPAPSSTPPAVVPLASVQGLLDAWDNARERSLAAEHGVIIPAALFEAVVDARARLSGTGERNA